MREIANIATLSGHSTFNAYIARPACAPTSAIIVLQEIFGVNAGIRSKCDKWAEAGYLALAPDLFWRLKPGIELDPDVEPDFQAALKLMGKFNQDAGIRDIEATIRYARTHAENGKVGAVGYCLGGRLAYMTATRTDVDASAGYYAVGVDGLLHEKAAIAQPLMLHIPTEDSFVGPHAQKAIHDALAPHPKVALHNYHGLDHGFASASGRRRNEVAANLADSRTAAFFAAHLH